MKVDPTIEMVLAQAVADRLYGSIELKLEAGRLVLIKKTETIKPQSYSNTEGRGFER